MTSRRILAALLTAAALTAITAFGQDEEREEDRAILRVPQASRVLEPAGERQAAQDVTAAADAAATEARVLDSTAAMARYDLPAAAIDAGRVVAVEDGRSEVVTTDNVAAKANAGAVFVQRLRAAPIEQEVPRNLLDDGERTALKLGFQVTAQTAGGETVKVDTWARDSTGLALDGSQSAWVGNFFVALLNSRQPEDRSRLAAPMQVAVTAVGAASISPRPFEIATLGQWHEASIVVPIVQGDTYVVSVSADPNGAGDSIDLAVTRPMINLSARSPSIVGWGIGQSTIDVRAVGLRSPAGATVSLRGTGGVTLDPVVLDAGGRGTARLRSTRAAGTEVTVLDPEAASRPLVVEFSTPWLFLGSAVAGGLAGAFVRGRGRRHWAMALAIGAVSAIIMTLAYAVGIDWPARLPGISGLAGSGEAVVLVLGAIAAWVGVSALVKPGAVE